MTYLHFSFLLMLFTPTLYIGLLKHIIPLAITLTSLQWEVIRNTDQILQRCPERRYLYRKIESRIRFDPRRTLEFPEVSVTFSVSSKWTDVNLQTARGQSQCPEVYTCSAKRIHLSKCRANFMLEGKTFPLFPCTQGNYTGRLVERNLSLLDSDWLQSLSHRLGKLICSIK